LHKYVGAPLLPPDLTNRGVSCTYACSESAGKVFK